MTSLIAHWLDLPPESRVVCALFVSQPASPRAREAVRRSIVDSQRNVEPIHALLPIIPTDSPALAVFAIASSTVPHNTLPPALESLSFPQLPGELRGTQHPHRTDSSLVKQSVQFVFERLYETSQAQGEARFVASGIYKLYLLFLQALRNRLLVDICATPPNDTRLLCLRLSDGFILVPRITNSEWAEGWDPAR